MDLQKWSDKYIQICEKALHTPDRSCIHGLLVSQLKLDVSPIVTENELDAKKVEEHYFEFVNQSRRRGRRSFDIPSEETRRRRKEGFEAILGEEDFEVLSSQAESTENIYESVEEFDSDHYLLPSDGIASSHNYQYTGILPEGPFIEVLIQPNLPNNNLSDSIEGPTSDTCPEQISNLIEGSNFSEDTDIITPIESPYAEISTKPDVESSKENSYLSVAFNRKSISELATLTDFAEYEVGELEDSSTEKNINDPCVDIVVNDIAELNIKTKENSEKLKKNISERYIEKNTSEEFLESDLLVGSFHVATPLQRKYNVNEEDTELELEPAYSQLQPYSKRIQLKSSRSSSPTEEWTIKEKHCYEDVQPVWKSYLYQVQLKAPKPHRVVCAQLLENKPYYYGKECHGPIPREQAEQLVMKSEGSYLTRESTRQPGTYALTFRFNNMARNYRLYYDQEEKMHYVGEKRFETIHDLVADGLITLYVDYNAKDYIEHMTLNVQPSSEIQHPDQHDAKSAPEETARGLTRPIQNSFKASDCEKAHNFKTHSYYGPYWCQYCRNFMWGLKAQGVRCQDCLYDCHKQCSTLVPLDCSPDKKLVKRVFGVDLTTFIKAHDQRRPAIVDSCINEIEKRGLDLEGLYRIPGFADDITTLMNVIDKDGVVPDISEASVDDVNVICGLLKLYFRTLPIPVITYDLYDNFVDAVKLEDRYEMIKALVCAIKCLPAAHYETLKYFCRHLQRLTKYKDKNLMNSENLGIVFGPTLMRAPDHLAFEAVGYIPYQKKIIQMLIEEQDLIFEK